jgi:hypothetical protein
MLDIRPMFAIPLAVTSIGREITKEEFDFIECQSIRNNFGNRISTDAQILKNDPLKNIREFIMVNVYDYFKQVYDPIDNFIPYMTLSWANYAKKGEFHPPHNHSNSLVSGVFYIRATENDTFADFESGPKGLPSTFMALILSISTSPLLKVKVSSFSKNWLREGKDDSRR